MRSRYTDRGLVGIWIIQINTFVKVLKKFVLKSKYESDYKEINIYIYKPGAYDSDTSYNLYFIENKLLNWACRAMQPHTDIFSL